LLTYWLPLTFLFAAAPRVAGSQASLFEGLGKHRRKVTTSSPSAQRFFDQGLAFLFAFNHDEAIRAFTEAARLDPKCAMAWWGIAIANGPHINNPVVEEARAKAAWNAFQKAKARSGQGTTVEKALIAAASARYRNPQPADRKPLDQAYATAMRGVWKRFPKDGDVGALYAEALMDLRPWDLWRADGKPQPGTPEIVATLEKVQKLNPDHPLALHLYIHAVEASPSPGKALASADRLRRLQPGLGHMVHMPSHIDVRTGRWKEAAAANMRAMGSDSRYRAKRPRQGFYRVYMLHNHHMLAFAAMMRGERALALRAIDSMIAGAPKEWLQENAAVADGFTAMPVEVRVRFGMWDEVLDAPEPAEYFPIARAMWRAARGIAFAAKGDTDSAAAEQAAFSEAVKAVPTEAFFGNNAAHDILGVARHMLAGEILCRTGKWAEGIRDLREAARREDRLRYDEPPDWILPIRHALGAALMQAGRPAEALKVYRDDLTRLPNNVWSLLGLAQAHEKLGQQKLAAEAQARYAAAVKDADIRINSSCLCFPGR
jgi:tetratricopeptide (TPR) repeat protein